MSEPNGSPDLKTFSTGAVRSKDADGAAFTLISPIAQQAEAEVLARGDVKYGTYNWEKGMPVRECLEHALQHINKYLGGDRSEPHLAHARTNLGFAIHSDACWPDLNTDLRRGDCIPPNVSDETAEERRRLRANLDAMKAGVKAAAGGTRVPVEQAPTRILPIHTDRGGQVYYSDIREGDILFPAMGVAGPSRVPTKYHIMPHSNTDRAALYRSDLQFEGYEVVSRWIEAETSVEVNEVDLQSCDVAIVLADPSWNWLRVDKARLFAKPIVAIGTPQPDDFPRHGQPERWFRSWADFLASLRSSPKVAPSAR